MEEPEEQIHSFVIRFWLEAIDEQSEQGLWRGHITHVASGERRYLKDAGSISAFIAPYLKELGRLPGLQDGAGGGC